MKIKASFLNFLVHTVILLTAISCNHADKDPLDAIYLKPIAGSSKLRISVTGNTSLIEVEYPKDNEISSEYIASFLAMTYCDSVSDNLSKNKIERISIQIGYPDYIDTFLYNVSLMKEYKKGLESTSEFIDHMLKSESGKSQDLVDPSKISKESLTQVNSVGLDILQNFRPKKISYDGFLIIPNESNKIQTKVRFANEAEGMYVSFQYDINTGKIFYFGVND